MFLCSTNLEQRVEENLCERLRHSEVAVAGADLKRGLQTLDGHCSDRIMLMREATSARILAAKQIGLSVNSIIMVSQNLAAQSRV